MDRLDSVVPLIKQKFIPQRQEFSKLFLLFSFFYGLIVIIYCLSLSYDEYTLSPRLVKAAPIELKEWFILYQQDGENTIPPTKKDEMIFHGSRDIKQIALTFDADMTPQMRQNLQSGAVTSYYDVQLIKTLRQTNTKATLFLTGMWIEAYPSIAQELADNPLFELGNHSYSHPAFNGFCYGLPAIGDATNEIIKTQHLLFDLTKRPNTLFRFPGGCYSQQDITHLQQNDLIGIQWDVSGVDGFDSDPQAIVSNVLTTVQNGSIIVLHMNGAPNDPATAQALPIIIENLRAKGFTFVTVSELLEKKDASLSKKILYLSEKY